MIFLFPRTPSAEKRLDVSRPSYRSCGKQTEARSLTSLIVSSAPPIAGFAERDLVTFAVSAKAGAAVALPSSGGRGLKRTGCCRIHGQGIVVLPSPGGRGSKHPALFLNPTRNVSPPSRAAAQVALGCCQSTKTSTASKSTPPQPKPLGSKTLKLEAEVGGT